MLPVVPLATASVDVAGTAVPIRSLSREAVITLAGLDPTEAEVFILAGGTGETPENVIAWRKATDSETVDVLLSAIAELSGLSRKDEDEPGEATPSSSGSNGR